MGGINFLVNNAGTNPHLDPKLTAEESHWDKILMSISKVISAWLKLVWAVYEDEGVGKSSIWHHWWDTSASLLGGVCRQ